MSAPVYDPDAELRKVARKRIEARQGFYWMLVVWLVVNGALTAIWFTSGPRDYFWPMWPMLGIGIGAVFAGAAAFIPGLTESSEAAVEREVAKMKQARDR